MKRFFILPIWILAATIGFSSCNDDNGIAGDDPDVTGDSISYKVTHVSDMTAAELIDSLCVVEPQAKGHVGLLTTLVPANTRVKIIDYTYESSNGLGGKAMLSAQLLIPTREGKVPNEYLIIDNHATQTADADVPTNQLNIGSVLCLMGAPVVTADLLGYGSTKDLPISYNCYHTGGVNTVDAALVAQQMLHSEWLDLNLKTTVLPVYNEGYSQGGYDAVAVQRYLETEASPAVRRQLPIRRTKCGGGPYDLRAFFEAVMQWEDYRYSPYIVTSFISFMNYHGELFPSDFRIEDILNEKVRNGQLVEKINSKLYGDDEIKSYVANLLDGDVSMSNLFVEDLISKDGWLHNLCLQLAEHDNVVKGWKPQSPIDFYHAKNDDCVPVECMYSAKEAFAGCSNVTFTEYNDPPKPGLHSLSYVKFITNILLTGWGD